MLSSNVIIWLVILVVMVVVEMLTMGLTTIWFAGGALIGAILALFHAPVTAQIIIALVISLALMFFTRPVAMKYFNKDRVKTNVESLIGHTAVVIGEIDNIKAQGRVNVGGQEWSARSFNDSVKIGTETVVEIIEVSGVKLIVKPVEEDK